MFSFLKITPDTAVALTAGKAPSYIEKQEFAAHVEKPGLTNPTDRYKPQRGEVIAPTRLNPAWTDLTANPIGSRTYSFGAVQSVRYDWVLTSPDLHLVVGLEKPWEHPEAFGFHENDRYWRQIAAEMESSGRTGHPTLVCSFAAVDPAHPERAGGIESTGLGLIGGELVYQNAGSWLINNNSGRFGVVKKLDANAKRTFLGQIESQTQRHYEETSGSSEGTAMFHALTEVATRFGENSTTATDEDYEHHVQRINALLTFVAEKFHREAGLRVITQRMSTHTGLWGDIKRLAQGKAAQWGTVSGGSSWWTGR
jgi:hypothetical protein